MAGLARFTVDETLEMLLGEWLQEIDSGDESDIEEDPEFPFPHELGEVLQQEEGEEGEGGGEEGEDTAVEVRNVVLLQSLSPGRLFPPAPMLLQLFPPSRQHQAYTFSSPATLSQ